VRDWKADARFQNLEQVAPGKTTSVGDRLAVRIKAWDRLIKSSEGSLCGHFAGGAGAVCGCSTEVPEIYDGTIRDQRCAGKPVSDQDAGLQACERFGQRRAACVGRRACGASIIGARAERKSTFIEYSDEPVGSRPCVEAGQDHRVLIRRFREAMDHRECLAAFVKRLEKKGQKECGASRPNCCWRIDLKRKEEEAEGGRVGHGA